MDITSQNQKSSVGRKNSSTQNGYQIRKGSFQFDPATKLISSSHQGNIKRKAQKPDKTLFTVGQIFLLAGFGLIVTLIGYNLMYKWFLATPRVSWLLMETEKFDTGVWLFVFGVVLLFTGVGFKVASGVKADDSSDSKVEGRQGSGEVTTDLRLLETPVRKSSCAMSL